MSDRLAAALAELVNALREELAASTPPIGPDEPEQLYGIERAADLMGIGRTALYGEIQAGRLRSLKVGRRRLVPASAIAEYANRAGAPA